MINIGIIGTRGIPNYYGGFEQFAQFLSEELVRRGHSVTVYNSSNHPYKDSNWNGVTIKHCKDPENKMGTAGQFIYDLNCIRDSRKQKFDIILQLGYTSSSIWWRSLPKTALIITNMDGLEWKRSKFSRPVQRFLKYAEKLGALHSDFLVADSIGIKEHLYNQYNLDSTFIPYGANQFHNPDETVLIKYKLDSNEYDMLIARLEPENNTEMILDAVSQSESNRHILVIGKHNTKFGAQLKEKYKAIEKIRFLGGIYDQHELNNLRFFCNLYIHGHSVGGTNPSLLEAMASSALIIAHDNVFNRSVTKENAFYFTSVEDLKKLLNNVDRSKHLSFIKANLTQIENEYSWKTVIDQYESLFKKAISER